LSKNASFDFLQLGFNGRDMIVKKFRGVDFVNRDQEIDFFLEYFRHAPERVLWVYGPKSAGKTTLIEYVIENKLDSNEYNVKYLNFRGLLIGSFDNFIEAFLEEKEDEVQTELNRNYNLLGVFKLEAKTLKKIKENKINLFHYLIEEFKREKRKNIFIIDEIQALQEIYVNGNGTKLLLNEFLNFCLRLTKETHLSHVLILTSNTIFLNEIYTNAKMKVTSDFELIDHLRYEDVNQWLTTDEIGFSQQEVDLIYEYLGGSVAHIKKLIDYKHRYESIRTYLEEMVEIAQSEIKFSFRELKKSDKEYLITAFYEVIKEILANGFCVSAQETKEQIEAIDYFCEKEILFYDPIKDITTANSQIYLKAFEKIIGQ